ncbi:MAG: nucleotide pyrophosphohydrolase [Patescibacteria group bacterium]
MTDIKALTNKIVKFRNKRNWKQFHNPKDVALSLVLEATEVMEHFQWKNDSEIKEHIRKSREEISEELADVLYWVLLMSNDFKIDIKKALENKMRKNEKKYPVNKAKDKHDKYNKI